MDQSIARFERVLKSSIKNKFSNFEKFYNQLNIVEIPRRSIPIKYQSFPKRIRIKTLQCLTRLEGGH